MSDGSKVRIELDMDELITSNHWEVQRKAIDVDGARGALNGFGQLRVVVNGEAVAALQIHEDRLLGVVLDVHPIRDARMSSAPAFRIELEGRGIVPPRTGRRS